jgi:hypothetical protein
MLQVTSLIMDRLKVVTATDEYGEAPIRVWCRESGSSLAKLGSAPPPVAPARSCGRGSRSLAAGGGGQGTGSGGAEDSEDEGGSEEEDGRAGWEGVTALACRGAVLVSGNAEGLIYERDYSCGGLPGQDGRQAEGKGGEGEQQLLGKFWRAIDVH